MSKKGKHLCFGQIPYVQHYSADFDLNAPLTMPEVHLKNSVQRVMMIPKIQSERTKSTSKNIFWSMKIKLLYALAKFSKDIHDKFVLNSRY